MCDLHSADVSDVAQRASTERVGTLCCVLSALAFGTSAVFGKLAYQAGVSVEALLLVRFGLSAALLVAISITLGELRETPVRVLTTGLALGAIAYAGQAALYFLALARIEASLVAMIIYLYPVLVVAGAIALRRERASVRRFAALLTALAGIVLVLGGAATSAVDALGVLMALGSALTYACFVLAGDRISDRSSPLGLASLVRVESFLTFGSFTTAKGGADFGFAAIGWLWLMLLAVVSTVSAIVLFLAGLARVGPCTTAILSVIEPVWTVTVATAVIGEVLSATHLVGGSLVIIAVLIVQRRSRQSLAPAEAGLPAVGMSGDLADQQDSTDDSTR